MKGITLIGALALISSSAFAGRLSNLLESGTISGLGTNYSFGFGGGYQYHTGYFDSFTGLATQSAQAGLADCYCVSLPCAFTCPNPSVTVQVKSNYNVYWTETVLNEGLPTHLYAKLNLIGLESGIERVDAPANNPPNNTFTIDGVMGVATRMGTGSMLPASTLTLNHTGIVPWVWLGLGGAVGKQTVTLGTSWTLVSTNPVTHFRTWSTPETIVSPVGSSSITGGNGVGYVSFSNYSSFSHGIFFDVTPN